MSLAHPLLSVLGFASLGAAAIYAILNVIAVLCWELVRQAGNSPARPPVTILKPLCGSEPGLYEHLRSFCRQDYPQFEIIFGVSEQTDPACGVVERLIAEFPALPLRLVVNPQLHGTNLKVSNLINMVPHATHALLVMADSDACVASDYLMKITAPLLDRNVGLVTCIYRGVPTRPIWSRLGAMYINEWYVPTVLVAWLFGHQGYVSGQTISLRRETLSAIGGLGPLANELADDYRLGQLVRGLGLRIVLSPYVVTGEHHETSLDSVTRHELRWMRTLRVLQPVGFCGLFLTFSLPLASLGMVSTLAAGTNSGVAWGLFITTLAARLMLHFVHRLRGKLPLLADLWLVPARDLLIFWVWCRSFFTSRVTWRGNVFDVGSDGVMHRLS